MNSTRMLHGEWRFWMSQTIRLPCHIFIGSRTLANDQIPANHLHNNTPCPQNVWHDLWSAFHHYQAWRNTLMTLITLETLWGMIWAYNIPLIRENLSRKVKNKLKLRDTQDRSKPRYFNHAGISSRLSISSQDYRLRVKPFDLDRALWIPTVTLGDT